MNKPKFKVGDHVLLGVEFYIPNQGVPYLVVAEKTNGAKNLINVDHANNPDMNIILCPIKNSPLYKVMSED